MAAVAPASLPSAAAPPARPGESGSDSGSGSEEEVEEEEEEAWSEGGPESPDDLLDPLWHVKDSAAFIAARATHVTLDRGAVRAVAATWTESGLGAAPIIFDRALHFVDESRPRLTAQYFFVLDALNFCFWPDADGAQRSGCAKRPLRRHLSRVLR